jgi:hypothetical protein
MKLDSKFIFSTIALALLFLICFVSFMPNFNNNPKVISLKNKFQKSKSAYNSQIMDIQRTINSLPCTNTDLNVKKANVPCEYMQKIKNRLGIFETNDNLSHLSMSKSELHLARLYLNTIKLSITNAFYIQFPVFLDGSAWPPAGQGNSFRSESFGRLLLNLARASSKGLKAIH